MTVTALLKPSEVAALRAIDSPTIANAIERLDLRDRTEGYIGGAVRCLFPDLGPMVGHAVTVTMDSRPGPVASRRGYWDLWAAVEAAPSPNVIVVQDVSGGPTRCAYIGEVMATLAARLGCVGLVTDGGVRDLEEVRAVGFHLFAQHVVVSHGNFEIVDVGASISLDGQVVQPGDVLHGDGNGIVIVPDAARADLLAAVEAIRRGESELMEFIRGPEFSVGEARQRAGY